MNTPTNTDHEARFANEEEISEMERKAEERVEFVVAIDKTFNAGNLEGCRVTTEFPMPNMKLAERKVRQILADKEKFERKLNETIHDVKVVVRLQVGA